MHVVWYTFVCRFVNLSLTRQILIFFQWNRTLSNGEQFGLANRMHKRSHMNVRNIYCSVSIRHYLMNCSQMQMQMHCLLWWPITIITLSIRIVVVPMLHALIIIGYFGHFNCISEWAIWYANLNYAISFKYAINTYTHRYVFTGRCTAHSHQINIPANRDFDKAKRTKQQTKQCLQIRELQTRRSYNWHKGINPIKSMNGYTNGYKFTEQNPKHLIKNIVYYNRAISIVNLNSSEQIISAMFNLDLCNTSHTQTTLTGEAAEAVSC